MRAQLPLALLLATSATACVDRTPATTDEVAAALEQENGGLDTADEAPLFDADEAFAAAAIEADTTVSDELASDPAMTALAHPPAGVTVDARDLVIVWGRFPADRDATTGRDWSGELKISRGAMLVRKKIAFEQATDRVLPRTSRDAISFSSVTRPAADGLVLTVFDPQPGTPLTLTYTPVTGSAHSIDLSQLASGPIVVDAGDGNRILIAGHRRTDTCQHGFVRGRWRALTPKLNGYLGVVASSDGEPIGHIRGIAGERKSGEVVMFGKFIDRDGHFLGLVKGTYENGRFAARWLDRQGDHGVLGGVYFPGANDSAGGFLGRWAETSCAAN